MKTAEDILEEYAKKVTEFSDAQMRKRNFDKDGNPIDRSNDIYVTDICSWDIYCPKKVYYDKINRRSPSPKSILRMTFGNVVHEIPLWDHPDPEKNGHEKGFEWNGIRCRMDEIDIENGIIIDKKTVEAKKIRATDYVTSQLNIYKVIAENNKVCPIKVNQLFVLNIITNGRTQCFEVPIWEERETMEYIDAVMGEIRAAVKNRKSPNIPYKSKGYLCDDCQYTDLCEKDTVPRN